MIISRTANQDTAVIIHIKEQETACKTWEEILTVAGINVIFIGPYDLSQSLGMTGQVDHPLVIREAEKIVRLTRAAGKVVGMFVERYRNR